MSFRSFTAVSVLLLITLLPGCGRKTALVPPQKLVPVTITDLRYVLDENGVRLMWSYPTKMENGDELQLVENFEIYRSFIPEKDFCQGCPVHYEEPIEIDGGRLPASGESREASYTEGYLQSGYRYFYKVRSRAGWWYPSGDSNVVSFVWSVVPEVPHGLQIEAADRSLSLSWEPVTENVEEKPLEHPVRYQVYRKRGDSDFVALGKPVKEAKFIDTGLQNERLYSYKVRALVTYDDTEQVGGASEEVSGVPRDLSAPPQPQHLVVVEIQKGVKLAWQAVEGYDLAGYRIYRREKGSAAVQLVAEVGPEENQYIDKSITTGRIWFYSVTSFDTAQPENESLPSEEGVIDLQ
jgi:fibronectin type 3 domain-containing protein